MSLMLLGVWSVSKGFVDLLDLCGLTEFCVDDSTMFSIQVRQGDTENSVISLCYHTRHNKDVPDCPKHVFQTLLSQKVPLRIFFSIRNSDGQLLCLIIFCILLSWSGFSDTPTIPDLPIHFSLKMILPLHTPPHINEYHDR